MRYMLLMLASPDEAEVPAPPPGADEPCWMPWYREMTAREVQLLDGAQLQPATTATTVAIAGGRVEIRPILPG